MSRHQTNKDSPEEEMVMCDTCQKECEARLMGHFECVYCESNRQLDKEDKY